MNKQHKKALFIFHRDLRIVDNIGLHYAATVADQVIPCFIFDVKQIGSKNQYKSQNVLQFMIQSIQELSESIKEHGGKLYQFHGDTKKIVENIIRTSEIDIVISNADYTPFSVERDEAIKHVCLKYNVPFELKHDALLVDPTDLFSTSGAPYQKFTSFYKRASHQPVLDPIARISIQFGSVPRNEDMVTHSFSSALIIEEYNKKIWVSGGRTEAVLLLKKVKQQHHYAKDKDFPALETTNLSAHLKFGTLSVRELYKKIVNDLSLHHPLIRQLYWRDFFTYIAYHTPSVFGHAFNQKFEHLSWVKSETHFERWCAGETGFPLVDAGMRQLNETGYMHNRVRMVVASFLTKDLHIDWRWGEQYFAQKLVDYDPSVNNGNWQWVASTGADSQPYFRIFNPWLQQNKFDPNAEYIKKWVPELKAVSARVVHTLYKLDKKTVFQYPLPMIDHEVERAEALIRYKKCR